MGFPLSRLCFYGPEEELIRTDNAQPAILTTSLACLRAAIETGLDIRSCPPAFVAGHSLGEYTALVAAGVLSFPRALQLVRERGRLMYEAGKKQKGGMLAILGLDLDKVAEICSRSGAQIANINCPGQIVISGTQEALKQAEEMARERKCRIVPLGVSGAFHSSLMKRALRRLVRIISSLRFRRPKVPIVANTTARPLTTTKEVKRELCQQLYRCVHWQGSVEFMSAQGVTTFIEFGPRNVLSGLIQRTCPTARTLTVKDLSVLEKINWTSLLE